MIKKILTQELILNKLALFESKLKVKFLSFNIIYTWWVQENKFTKRKNHLHLSYTSSPLFSTGFSSSCSGLIPLMKHWNVCYVFLLFPLYFKAFSLFLLYSCSLYPFINFVCLYYFPLSYHLMKFSFTQFSSKRSNQNHSFFFLWTSSHTAFSFLEPLLLFLLWTSSTFPSLNLFSHSFFLI